MNTLSLFQSQLDTIAQGNLKIIERVPEDKLLWKPHEKSMTLGRLAQHLAELPHWMNRILDKDHFDFVLDGFKVPAPPASLQEILDLYRTKYAAAKAALANAEGINMDEEWQMRRNGTAFTKYPRAIAINTQLDHMVHHRGQLSVYLRLLDVPVPGMFGPSADDRH
ncbi:MAG: DUF664 domain-containing protein [Bacteroidetes bacterium]|nr:DUF664 domain-containing protein [Bacteroidota bacterium]